MVCPIETGAVYQAGNASVEDASFDYVIIRKFRPTEPIGFVAGQQDNG